MRWTNSLRSSRTTSCANLKQRTSGSRISFNWIASISSWRQKAGCFESGVSVGMQTVLAASRLRWTRVHRGCTIVSGLTGYSARSHTKCTTWRGFEAVSKRILWAADSSAKGSRNASRRRSAHPRPSTRWRSTTRPWRRWRSAPARSCQRPTTITTTGCSAEGTILSGRATRDIPWGTRWSRRGSRRGRYRPSMPLASRPPR